MFSGLTPANEELKKLRGEDQQPEHDSDSDEHYEKLAEPVEGDEEEDLGLD